MAFRFRKSFKIAPGIRVNVGKNGVSSIGVGPRGASVSIGKQGIYSNVGIAGTGLSFRSRMDNGGDRKRLEREERRLLKAQEKLQQLERQQEALSKVTLKLDENGSIDIVNSFGDPLSRSELKMMWEQQSDTILNWLQDQADEINGDVELLENIYQETTDPNSLPEYSIREFEEPKPKKPIAVNEPQKDSFPKLGFFAKLFKSKREAYQKQIEVIEEKYKNDIERWEKEKSRHLRAYENDLKEWKSQKEEFDNKQKHIEENFEALLREDTKFMEEMLEGVLNTLSWPRETLISYEIDHDGHEAWVDVDLPEIEDMLQKVASIAASGKKLNIKNKPNKQLQLEYAKHIHGIAFRIAGTIFATLPTVKMIIISGYSQRLDPATGKVSDDYLYSFKIERNGFSQIDFNTLDAVDPIAAMDLFEKRKKMTAMGIFKAIEPFAQLA